MTTIEVLSDTIDTTTAVSDTVLELTPSIDKPLAAVLSDDDIKNWLEKKRKQRLKLNVALLFVAVLIIILLKFFIPANSTIEEGAAGPDEKFETTVGSSSVIQSKDSSSASISSKDSSFVLVPVEKEKDPLVPTSNETTKKGKLSSTRRMTTKSQSKPDNQTSQEENSKKEIEIDAYLHTQYFM